MLIIDPGVKPTDGATIVVALRNNGLVLPNTSLGYSEAGIRKLQHHAGSLYISGLKALELTPEKIDAEAIIGTIIEVRMQIDESNVDC